MKEFKVEVTETLEKVVKVKARTKEEALDKIEELYGEDKITLTHEDIIGTEITIYEEGYGHKYRIDSTD